MSEQNQQKVIGDRHSLTVCSNDAHMQAAIERYLNTTINKLLTSQQKVLIGVSGGSMPTVLAPVLAKLPDVVVDRCFLFPVDERLVPLDSDDSNSGAYLRALPEKFRSHFICAEQIENASRSAELFEGALKQYTSSTLELGNCRIPVVDIAFLGLGPDGHTCSLFPGHPLMQETNPVAAIEDSPKPPPRRITITLPVLSAAKHVAFISTGNGKAEVLRKIIVEKDQNYPPSLIQRQTGHHIDWFLDASAAAQL